MANKRINLCSVSWIDARSLPPVGLQFFATAMVSWPRRVLIGLIGTANPTPPTSIRRIASFRQSQEFRALMSCTVGGADGRTLSEALLDPGWTPPLNKSKFDPGMLTQLAAEALPNDNKSYPGEKSALSQIVGGRLHPSSSLKLPQGAHVLASALIKFRAGEHTNAIGIGDLTKGGAKSPFHVPWVWCEFALVKTAGRQLRLLGAGSTFPSHRWYVDGEMVGECLQRAVTVSDKDSALSSGQPAKEIQAKAETDRALGSVTSHANAIGACAGIDVALPMSLSNQ